LLVLFVLPFVNTSETRSSLYRPISQKFFWLLVADYIFLGYLGQQVAESPYIEIGQVASIFYFSYFLVIIPVLGGLEKVLRFA
jgi:ubiquinol-cytochrome c reductase cytochrome b subunit